MVKTILSSAEVAKCLPTGKELFCRSLGTLWILLLHILVFRSDRISSWSLIINFLSLITEVKIKLISLVVPSALYINNLMLHHIS